MNRPARRGGITNELVANSVGHSALGEDAYIKVTVAMQRDLVRIDVHDRGVGFTMPDGQPQQFGGRGFAIVQALSTLVGISHDGETHAWAEIELAARRDLERRPGLPPERERRAGPLLRPSGRGS